MSERLFVRLEGDAAHGPESGAPAGSLQDAPVRPELRRVVAHVLVYRERIPDGAEILERVVPDGAVRLAFNLGDAPGVGAAPGLQLEAIGASVEPALVRLRGAVAGISVTLRPGAAAAVLGVPAAELTGRAVSLDELWGSEAGRVLEELAEAKDDDERAARVQDAIERRLRGGSVELHRSTLRAAQVMAESGGTRPLREVAAAVGIGERRLQQLFKEQVGLAPRAFNRLNRLHACLRMLRRMETPAWAEVAVDAGFYDQSHLINEFRALTGLSPTEFLRRSVSGSSNTAP